LSSRRIGANGGAITSGMATASFSSPRSWYEQNSPGERFVTRLAPFAGYNTRFKFEVCRQSAHLPQCLCLR
jgi:hypothetical protein